MKRALLFALLALGLFSVRADAQQPAGATPVVATKFITFPAVIASGQSLSGAVQLGSMRMFAIVVPSGWTTANITFQSSIDGTNWAEVYDSSGAEVTFTVGASPPYFVQNLDASQFLGTQYLKIRSGTAASPVNQASGATLTIVGQ